MCTVNTGRHLHGSGEVWAQPLPFFVPRTSVFGGSLRPATHCAGSQDAGVLQRCSLMHWGIYENKLNVSIFHIRRIVSNYGKSYTEFRNTCRVFKAGFGSYAFISNPSLLTHE